MKVIIRSATPADFSSLKAIEIDAFETLRAAGAVSGEAASSSDDELQQYLDAGVLLVAVDAVDSPVGYVGALVIDRLLHIGEIDVHPAWQRKGLGRRLMLSVLEEGRVRGLLGATLTTDRFAPFNARFYASLGFRQLDEAELSDRLSAVLVREHAAGLDPRRRVAMHLEL